MTYRVKLSSQIRTLADCGPVSLLSLWFAPPFRLRPEKVGGLEFFRSARGFTPRFATIFVHPVAHQIKSIGKTYQ